MGDSKESRLMWRIGSQEQGDGTYRGLMSITVIGRTPQILETRDVYSTPQEAMDGAEKLFAFSVALLRAVGMDIGEMHDVNVN